MPIKETRVIVIDAKNRKIYSQTVSGLSTMQAIVEGYIESAHRRPNDDTLFVNEEGLFQDWNFGFVVHDDIDAGPYVGNGFFIGGTDDEGESLDAVSKLEEIQKIVRFVEFRATEDE